MRKLHFTSTKKDSNILLVLKNPVASHPLARNDTEVANYKHPTYNIAVQLRLAFKGSGLRIDFLSFTYKIKLQFFSQNNKKIIY